MTCIIGLQTDNAVYIGGDSAGVLGWEVREQIMPKVFRNGKFIIGTSHFPRMTQLLMYKLKVPHQEAEIDCFEFIATVFIDTVKTCLAENGFSSIENNIENYDGEFLVGYRKNIYKIESNYNVGSFQDGVEAIGNGREYALGAMKAYDHIPANPIAKIEESLKVAAYYSGAVIPPFTILKGNK